MVKYISKVLSVGECASEMFHEGIIIFFGPMANSGLEDYSIIIQKPEHETEFLIGDTIQIGDECFEITAVGEKVKETFSSLGHFALRFDGASEAALPGSVHVMGEMPSLCDGDTITVF